MSVKVVNKEKLRCELVYIKDNKRPITFIYNKNSYREIGKIVFDQEIGKFMFSLKENTVLLDVDALEEITNMMGSLSKL